MQIKTRCPVSAGKLATTKETDNIKCWRGCGQTGAVLSFTVGGGAEHCLSESYVAVPIHTEDVTHFSPSSPLLGACLGQMLINELEKAVMDTFTVAPSIKAKHCK